MREGGYVILTLKCYQEEGQWVATCVELGTSTHADTFEEADEQIRELVVLHLNSIEEVGERERFFRKNKIKMYPHQPREKDIKKRQCKPEPDIYHTVYIQPIHEALL